MKTVIFRDLNFSKQICFESSSSVLSREPNRSAAFGYLIINEENAKELFEGVIIFLTDFDAQGKKLKINIFLTHCKFIIKVKEVWTC